MAYKNLNLPATIVHEVNGKKYRINGTLMSINESAGVCTVKFNNKTSNKIPVSEVYLNEGVIDKLKEVGSKTWSMIKRVIRTIGGFLLPVDEKGNKLTQFINAPVNVASMKLKNVDTVVSDEVRQYAEDHSMKLGKNVKTLDDALDEAEARDSKEIEKYWSRVMSEYAKPENESLNLGDTVKLVNEKYYHEVIPSSKTLNEAAIPSLHNLYGGYGEEVNSKQLVDLIYNSLWSQLNPLSNLDPNKEMDEADTAKPLLIWGAPGIGKTAIISKAAKLLEDDGYRLGMHIIKCAALKRDDFELPDTVHNIVGQKLAVSNPKTWLPVYDPKGLTRSQLAITDMVYNTGIYKMTNFKYTQDTVDAFEDAGLDDMVDVKRKDVLLTNDSDKTTSVIDTNSIYSDLQQASIDPKIKELLDKSEQNGGIIFFDEFARLQSNVTNIMMGLMGERMYGEDYILASQWTTIAAANRLSDDLKSEGDDEFRQVWDNAKQGRYQHYTYVPTKEDWLEWARSVNKHTGLQNVDEKFCKFIEVSPAYVWYNALDLHSQDDTPDDVKKALSKLGTIDNKGQMTKNKVGILDPGDLDTIGSYLEDKESIDQLSVNTWNPRTWDEVVNTNMIQALRQLIGPTKEDLLKVMSPVEHTKVEYGEKIKYEALSLDDEKLAEALNDLPIKKWFRWAEGKQQRVDPSGYLIKNDRIGYWNKWIETCLIPDAVGVHNKPAKEWKEYVSTRSLLTPETISQIWEKGYSNNESLVKFNKIGKYDTLESEKWKAQDPVTINKVINEVISNYPGDFDKDVLEDYQIIKNLQPGTQADLNRLKPQFDIKLIDGDRSKIENGKVVDPAYKRKVNILFDDEILSPEESLIICALIDNCPVAKKYINVIKWLAILSLELNNTEYISKTVSDLSTKYIKSGMKDPDYAQYMSDKQTTIKPSFAVFEYIRTTVTNLFTKV